MLRSLLAGLPVIVMCLFLQAVFLTACLRHYGRFLGPGGSQLSPRREIGVLSGVMLLMLIGNLAQTAIWAILFLILGEFDDFQTAAYFSGVTFATLGYGDLVLSERWRLLSSIEAANGILMFGVSTSVMTAAVMDVIKRHSHSAGE